MDSRLIKPKALPQPLLKDYLLDDMSSCSSNGFKSFPRRQCCSSTVRFLIEIDLKNKHNNQKKHTLNFNKTPPPHSKNPSKCALVAFQTLITAVKRLPFGGAGSPEKKRPRHSFLRRSLSTKILKKTSFWKRKNNHKEIELWKSHDQTTEDGYQSSDLTNSSTTSHFTASDDSSSGNSSCAVNSKLPDIQNDAVKLMENDGGSPDSTTTTDSSSSTNSSPKNEDKEQFSPVSVLDCPFKDDDGEEEEEEISSPYQHRLARLEGTKKNLMEKFQRFECLAALEPVNLAKRFVTLPDSDNESTSSLLPQFSASSDDEILSNFEEELHNEENEAQQKALSLLQQMKDTMPSYGLKIKADKFLLDFFMEKIISQNMHCGYRGGHSFDEEVLDEAENWINERKPRESFLESDVARNREVYIKDMEKGGKWKLLNQEDYEEMARELANEVFDALLNELLLDISS